MMTKRIQRWIAFSLFMIAIPARAQNKANNQGAQPPAAAQAADSAAAKAATDDPNYVIGGQDMLDISVWKEPDVSRIVPVRPDGKISLPLLGDVQATGLTPLQLAAQITTGLNKFITSPQVTITVSQINSRRIYLLGEVARAGAYPLLPEMTFLQALSNAGGFTPFANSKKIYLLRQENGKQVKIFFNYKDAIAGRNPEQNILLKSGDTIVVP
jgi:polysaccharide biosynthesis/export protein